MSDPLQFDRAEPAAAATYSACALCKSPLASTYHVARNLRFCGACRAAYEAEARKRLPPGRLAAAFLLGVAAVAVTDAAYALVFRAHLGVGLVAVFAGVITGYAVRKGSGNRGGRVCQVLATTLTLAAVAIAFLARPTFALPGLLWPVVLTCFALAEAWGINRSPALVFHGPYEVGKAIHG